MGGAASAKPETDAAVRSGPGHGSRRHPARATNGDNSDQSRAYQHGDIGLAERSGSALRRRIAIAEPIHSSVRKPDAYSRTDSESTSAERGQPAPSRNSAHCRKTNRRVS